MPFSTLTAFGGTETRLCRRSSRDGAQDAVDSEMGHALTGAGSGAARVRGQHDAFGSREQGGVDLGLMLEHVEGGARERVDFKGVSWSGCIPASQSAARSRSHPLGSSVL